MKITFDKAPTPEDLGAFPLMVRLAPERFDYGAASAGGDDLRFVDADGSSPLSYEIEQWNEDGESIVWVRVPQIDAGSTVDHVWLYYANGSAPPAEDAAAVWAGSHAGVYHLADDPSGGVVEDSTSAGNHGVPMGSMTSGDVVPGRVGRALDFDGDDDFVALGGNHVPAFEVGPGQARTLEAWLRTSTEDRQALTDEASCSGWGLDVKPGGALSGRLFLGDDGCPAAAVYTLDSPASYADGDWHYVAVVLDRPNGSMRLHVDGALVATHPVTIDNALPVGGYYDRIGTNFNNTRPFDGRINEVRVATVARGAASIAAQHASMTDALASFAATESAP